MKCIKNGVITFLEGVILGDLYEKNGSFYLVADHRNLDKSYLETNEIVEEILNYGTYNIISRSDLKILSSL